jgi:hypothetical protein
MNTEIGIQLCGIDFTEVAVKWTGQEQNDEQVFETLRVYTLGYLYCASVLCSAAAVLVHRPGCAISETTGRLKSEWRDRATLLIHGSFPLPPDHFVASV